MNTVVFEKFVNIKAGEAYRLFPFGKIVKNGKVRDITPEFAARFNLPHFKPAIKLGSHEDTTPAGGHIIALEVRADGLYAVPEFNDKGTQALTDGAYRYHSPEIIWEGGLENPVDGTTIPAPLILGDALLHTPHLGESASLYSVETITQENNIMTTENVTFPANVWEKYIAPLLEKKQEVKEIEIEKVVEPEDYSALKSRVAEYEAERTRLQAEAERKGRVEKFDAELKETKADPTMAELLADLDPEKAELVMKQFKALSAQIDESALTEEKGTGADGKDLDAQGQFNAAVLEMQLKDNINYVDAFEKVKKSNPELFEAWSKRK